MLRVKDESFLRKIIPFKEGDIVDNLMGLQMNSIIFGEP